MPIENFELVGSYNNQRFPNIDAERTINMFEYIDMLGKKPRFLISTSGIINTGLLFPGSNPTDGFRAEFVLGNFEYLVIGPNIYRRDINDVITKLNSLPLPTSSGYVGVDANNAPNGSQILFVDGEIGCIWDTGTNQFTYDIGGRLTSTTLIPATDPAFPFAPIDVCFIDGFLVVANAGDQSLQIPNNTFQLSGFNDAYSWGLVQNNFTTNIVGFPNELIVTTAYATGMSFKLSVSGGGVLPNPLVAGTIYYAIRDPLSVSRIKVASTFANALAGIFIPLTTNAVPTTIITNTVGGTIAPGQLQQGQINTHPGPIVACRTLHRRVFFFSTNYTEVWENAGIGTNLPLRRNNALLIELGTPARGSIVTGFDKMIFLSNDRDGLSSVMMVAGTEAIPISNRALDFQLAQYAANGQIADARGIFIKEQGIIFYRLNFTLANHTFVYNLTFSNPTEDNGKRWHEEQLLNGDRHPAQTHGYFNGNNYYGAYNKPILYFVDPSLVTNDGETIARIRIGRSYVPSTYNQTRIDRFMVDIIQGLAQITPLGGDIDLLSELGLIITTETDIDLLLESSGLPPLFNPNDHVIYLSVSKDGGVTYLYRQAATVGAIGQRAHRTVWRKLGVIPRGQGFVPKIEFYAQIPFIILGAAWAFEVMPE